MNVETPRLRLRAWLERDRAPFAKMNADPNVMKFLGPPLTPDQNDAVIDAQIDLMRQGCPAFWAVERRSDHQFMGCIGVKKVNFETKFTPAYEIGWRLASEFWRQGYATEGAKAALSYAFETWAMEEIYSFTVLDNIPSQSVMKKIGMTHLSEKSFDHPALTLDDPLRRHVLFRIRRGDLR